MEGQTDMTKIDFFLPFPLRTHLNINVRILGEEEEKMRVTEKEKATREKE
jgi:hypothetical protein